MAANQHKRFQASQRDDTYGSREIEFTGIIYSYFNTDVGPTTSFGVQPVQGFPSIADS